jgi:hypothetical protein
MNLNRIELRNFKGCKQYTLDLAGRSASVYGDNQTGKTTLADAWAWLLFGKDSAGATDFEIAPIGSRGQGIMTEVAAEIDHNGMIFRLKRIRRENWVKERGNLNPTFKGYITDYFDDGLKKSEAEWKQLINGFMPETMFKILSNPEHFPRMKWQEQRDILIGLIGDVSDEQVIADRPELADLADRGPRHSVDEYAKVLKQQRTEYNQQLQALPARIDEARRSIGADVDVPAAQARKVELQAQAEALARSLRTEPGEAEKRLLALHTDLRQLEAENSAYAAEQQAKAKAEQSDKMAGLHHLRSDLMAKAFEQQSMKQAFDRETTALSNKAATVWAEREAMTGKEWNGSTACTMCRRPYPAEQVEQARRDFNANKANVLEQKLVVHRALLSDANTNKAEADKAAAALAELNKQIEEVDRQTRELSASVAPVSPMPGYAERRADLTAKIAALEADAKASASERSFAQAAVLGEIEGIKRAISDMDMLIAQHEQNERQRARIEELKEEQRRVGDALTDVDRRLYLCDQFVRAKVAMIEQRIQGAFSMPGLSFKLFRDLINGGVEPCCEITVNGVPYSNVNNGARINAGLCIIDTLGKHYGYSSVVWIDNAEAVTRLQPCDMQIIRLVVSEPHKELKVEVA